jgi:hypothetical protein
MVCGATRDKETGNLDLDALTVEDIANTVQREIHAENKWQDMSNKVLYNHVHKHIHKLLLKLSSDEVSILFHRHPWLIASPPNSMWGTSFSEDNLVIRDLVINRIFFIVFYIVMTNLLTTREAVGVLGL